MKSLLGRLLAPLRPARAFPFALQRPAEPDAGIAALFRRAFGADPPREPWHFAAHPLQGGPAAAYVHYIEYRPGVFLCGGLCVDARAYRRLATRERRRIARDGSLSRWLLARSIEALPAKQAVFAYTGSAQSRRDVLALGFEAVAAPHLYVQWHACPEDMRAARAAEIAALGPF